MERVICENCEGNNSKSAKYCSGCGRELPQLTIQVVESTPPKKENSTKKKRILSFAVGIVAFMISYFGVQYLFFRPPSFDKMLMEVASEINASCPIMVDQDTRLDNAVAMPENVFQYNYTLLNFTVSEIDTVYLRNTMEPELINVMRTNPDMETFRKLKVTMAYNYNDKNGAHVIKMFIKPNQYLQL